MRSLLSKAQRNSCIIFRTKTSSSWICRHTNDIYVKKSIENDLRSRSSYKLKQIQEQFKIIQRKDIIIDMGAAPGGWSIVATELAPEGKVIAIDLLPIQSIPGCHIIEADMLDPGTEREITGITKGCPVDIILSDMMINTTGDKCTDHFRSMDLCHFGLKFCQQNLKVGGHFICKYFRGEDEPELMMEARRMFEQVKAVKPAASRSESREMFMVALRKIKNLL